MHRTNLLHESRTRRIEETIFESDHTQSAAHGVEEFAGSKQEYRVRRFADRFIPDGEGFVDQRAARRERIDQAIEERPMQIVRDHDRIERSVGQGPRRAVFEIGRERIDASASASRSSASTR